MGRASDQAVEIAIGYAAGPNGGGVAYASVGVEGTPVLRLPFRINPSGALAERRVGYAALATVTQALFKRGVRRVQFALEDARLVDELTTRCDLPDALSLAYVRVRCALNALERWSLRVEPTDELTQRARAEAALNLAA